MFNQPFSFQTLLKNLKGLIGKVCMEEHGSLLLMAICDCVDDTVLMKKTVIQVLYLHYQL